MQLSELTIRLEDISTKVHHYPKGAKIRKCANKVLAFWKNT